MKAGIDIDSWKLGIFETRLKDAGYQYTVHPGLTPDTRFLKVETNDLLALKLVIRAAITEAHNSRTKS